MDRDKKLIDRALARLVLGDADSTVNDVGAKHFDDIAAALAGVKQQGKREPLACPKRPAMFELGDLRFRPSMIGSEPIWFETREWIVCAYAGVDRVGYHLRKDRACQVRHARARGADVLDDMPRNPVSFLQGPSLCTSAPFMAKRQTL
jgi:hypothetical protein